MSMALCMAPLHLSANTKINNSSLQGGTIWHTYQVLSILLDALSE